MPTTRSIFLTGFMAAGKSSVGRELASRLGLIFVDLDDEIEARAGTVAEIFADRGESGFRALESEVLRDVLERAPCVVATGGGAPCFGDNLLLMRNAGWVITLHASLDAVLARVDDPSTRPLLSQSPQELAACFASRIPVYRQAHGIVLTEGLEVGDVASQVASLVALIETYANVDEAGSTRPELQVASLGARSYPIVIAKGALASVGSYCRQALPSCTRVGMISDSNVAPLYLAATRASLEAAGFDVCEHVFTAGEPSKTLESYEAAIEAMLAGGVDRSSAIIAVGGGVVGDLAGFVAATLMRGVSYIQVPTTLLAMVDSSVGGKTAVNLPTGKNLVGAFWQPQLVVIDPDTLSTLPAKELRAACGELIKYALLDSDQLFVSLESISAGFADGGMRDDFIDELTSIIRKCVAIKSWIVALDETERSGTRALLNLGHTLGHAIEAATEYREYLHGEAVALGLRASCRLSERVVGLPTQVGQRVKSLIEACGLDSDVDRWMTDDVFNLVVADKKRIGDAIQFIVVRDIGDVGVRSLTLTEIESSLRAA